MGGGGPDPTTKICYRWKADKFELYFLIDSKIFSMAKIPNSKYSLFETAFITNVGLIL